MQDSCRMDSCAISAYCRGLCARHYKIEHREGRIDNWPRRGVEYSGQLCSFPVCDRDAVAHNLCNAHYTQKRKGRSLTEIGGRKPCLNPRCEKTVLKHHSTCKSCSRVKNTYSLSDKAFVSLMSNYACSNPGCSAIENLHVDHDHTCCNLGDFKPSYKRSCGGCVRGWLCSGCNTALGLMQEDPERIQGLLAYLADTRR